MAMLKKQDLPVNCLKIQKESELASRNPHPFRSRKNLSIIQ